ncbi:hypothetical protein GCM10009680_64080 [Streptomyces yatensis]|uniref:Uncharacterized protein n=1 Tax=Streptomyces yatensis TaxID=155177 RepID=A0ABP4UXQ6_9ACTN
MPVVVLDQQHGRVGREHRSQLAGAGRAHHRAGRVLRPVGDHQRPRPLGQRLLHPLGQRSVVVDPDRDGAQPERRDQVEQTAPAGVLDRDRVTGTQMRGQHPLDRVERAGGDGDRPGRHPVRVEGGPGEFGDLGDDVRRAVQRGALRRAGRGRRERRAERGQQRGVGVAARQIARPGGIDADPLAGRTGGARAHPAPPAPRRFDHAPFAQHAIGGRDRIGIHAQPLRQLPQGRQQLARWQLAGADRALHTGRDLGCASADDRIFS